MRTSIRAALALLALVVALPVSATFHLWQMSELYSNADGSVQFLEITALTSGQEFVAGHTLRSTPTGGATQTFTFPSNLPGDSSGRRMLIGTQGFAALNIVAPDYTVPNGFFAQGGGSINFAEFADVWTHPAAPSPPLSLGRSGSTSTNSPMNFAGATGTVPATTTPPPTASLNFHALWWRSPAGSENGWGINVTHQGDVLFATWYTYNLDGSALWLFSDAHKTATNTYFGQLYRSRGSPFSSVPYDSSRFAPSVVGSITFTFTDANNGTVNYTVNGITQSKPITRYVYASPVPTCVAGSASDNANYQDLWWRQPGGSENGWGVNILHQGEVLFATWYTYGPDGTDMWMVMSAGTKIAERTYKGDIHRTTSGPFNAYDPSLFKATLVGTGTFTFVDGNNGTFSYTVDGVTQSKPITRYLFATPLTTCSFNTSMADDPMDPYYP